MRQRAVVLAMAGLVLASGCLGIADDGEGDAETSPASTNADDAGALAERRIPFQTEGTLPAGAHVDGMTAPAGTFDRWFELSLEGTVTGAELTMTWEATNPTMETLLIGFGPLEGSGGNSHASSEAIYATGSSPLTLTIEDVDWATGEYVVWAWWDPDTDPQASPMDQAFEIEGTIETTYTAG